MRIVHDKDVNLIITMDFEHVYIPVIINLYYDTFSSENLLFLYKFES